jgi:hypothetical protein
MTNSTLPANPTPENNVMALAAQLAGSRVDYQLNQDKQDAQMLHYTFVAAGQIGKGASMVVRNTAAKMWLDGAWKELELPYANDPNEKISFDDFGAWVGYAVEEAGLSDTTASTLKNFIVNILDPVAKQLIINPSTKEPYTVNEVLNLREKHTQKLASASRRILSNGDMNEGQQYETLGALIGLASDPTISGDDFIDKLREGSFSTRRNDPFIVRKANQSGKAIYMIVIDETKEPLVATALEGRVDWRSSTVDDFVTDLMSLQVTDDQLNDVSPVDEIDVMATSSEDISDKDVNDWLGDL